jgi:hypothetical protein
MHSLNSSSLSLFPSKISTLVLVWNAQRDRQRDGLIPAQIYAEETFRRGLQQES